MNLPEDPREEKALQALVAAALHPFNIDAEVSEEEVNKFLATCRPLTAEEKTHVQRISCNPQEWEAGGTVSHFAGMPLPGSPVRVQLSRKKGWKKPANTVVVSRPSKFGNPFWKGTGCRMSAAWSYECAVRAEILGIKLQLPAIDPYFRRIAESLPEIAGKNLACWCPKNMPDSYCHAGKLIDLANNQVSHGEGDSENNNQPESPLPGFSRELERENAILYDFINREMKMAAGDPRIAELKNRIAAECRHCGAVGGLAITEPEAAEL